MQIAKRFPLPMEPLRMLPLILVSLSLVMAAVDALLALQPSVLQPLRTSWESWAGAGWVPASSANLVATSVAVACSAVTAAVLATFIRGVQTAPYVWLAPLVVGVCCALIGGSVSELPIPISPRLFAGIAALMLLGGGALVYYDSLAARCAGALLLAAPIALLIAGAAQPGATSSAALHTLPRVVALLGIAAVGALLLSLANRRMLPADRAPEQMGERLLELLERAKAGEARADLAERELAAAELHSSNPAHSMLRMTSDEQAIELLRPRALASAATWAALCFALVAIALGYFLGYAPLKQRLIAVQDRTQAREAEHGAAIRSLRATFADERAALERQIEQAKAPARAAAEPAPSRGASSTESALQPGKEAAPAASPKPALPLSAATSNARAAEEARAAVPMPSAEPQQARSTPAHHHAASHHGSAHAQRAKAKAATTDAASKSAPAHAHDDDNESINDDPIGGL